MPVEEQVVLIFAGTNGYLDDIPVARRQALRDRAARVLPHPPRRAHDTIRSTGALPEGDELADAIADFKAEFLPTASGRDGRG